MINERVKEEERRQFTKEEKEHALSKSGGKCAHCGKEIKVGTTFTVEHVIPLSKGGTNNLRNLVGLCEECNKLKDSDIIVPSMYYYHLSRKNMKILLEDYNKYLEEKEWFSFDTLFSEDKFFVTTYRMAKREDRDGHAEIMVPTQKLVEKVKYSDLNSVFTFLKEFNQKYFPSSSDDETVKGIVSDCFTTGNMYMVRDNTGILVLFYYSAGLIEQAHVYDEDLMMEGIGASPRFYLKSNFVVSDRYKDTPDNVKYIYFIFYGVMAKLMDNSRGYQAVYIETNIAETNKLLFSVLALFAEMHKGSMFKGENKGIGSSAALGTVLINKKLGKVAYQKGGNAKEDLRSSRIREGCRKADKLLRACVEKKARERFNYGLMSKAELEESLEYVNEKEPVAG